MQTAKHDDSYTPDNYIMGPDIYAVMLYGGSYITEDRAQCSIDRRLRAPVF